ncbi:uncharacterized protein BDZ99DRAFT_466700 [Mytilinidion resinicola]|uniref:Uncharacterized protein n=1 Tax=Mytilinidion resinicola TaxID=574789 RepID=A0A6A6YAJ1_9PEZI|nr:uncharacterized protein BDZ99DRAFT_466700 [Mytilinidion resinicola]KAF2805024.1 hypothetical protein BDZ99DRAFT_466700 [Mytilinidion resinicola]
MEAPISDSIPYEFSISDPSPAPVLESELYENLKKIMRHYRKHGALPKGDKLGHLNDPEILQIMHKYVLENLHFHYIQQFGPECLLIDRREHGLSAVWKDWQLKERECLVVTAPWVDIELNGHVIVEKVSQSMIEKIGNFKNYPYEHMQGLPKGPNNSHIYRIRSNNPFLPAAIKIVVGWMEHEVLCPGQKYFGERIEPNEDVSLRHSLIHALRALGLLSEAHRIDYWFKFYLRRPMTRLGARDVRTIWHAEGKRTNNVYVEELAKHLARTSYREARGGARGGVDFPLDFGRNAHMADFLNEEGNERLKAQVVRWDPTLSDQTTSDVRGEWPDVVLGMPEEQSDLVEEAAEEGVDGRRVRALRPDKQQEIYRERLVAQGRRYSMPTQNGTGKRRRGRIMCERRSERSWSRRRRVKLWRGWGARRGRMWIGDRSFRGFFCC